MKVDLGTHQNLRLVSEVFSRLGSLEDCALKSYNLATLGKYNLMFINTTLFTGI